MVTGLTSLRLRRWLMLGVVLPALALRVLVPAGFMPMRDEQGRLSLMLCPGDWPAALTAAADRHAHHHHPGADPSAPASSGDDHRGSAAHTLCPFAASAGPALAYSVDVDALTSPGADYLPRSEHSDPLIQPLPRAQSARGPPLPHQV